MKRILFLSLRLIVLSALGGATWVAHRPEILPAVAAPLGKGKEDELLNELQQAAIKRAAVMEIPEADINRYLSTTLAQRIGSKLGEKFALVGTRVDLELGVAHVVLIWNLYGFERTASVDLAIERRGDAFHVELLGGAFGHLKLPRGMMRPLFPALDTVSDALDPEIRALFQMTQITFAKDKLVLDSRFPSA